MSMMFNIPFGITPPSPEDDPLAFNLYIMDCEGEFEEDEDESNPN